MIACVCPEAKALKSAVQPSPVYSGTISAFAGCCADAHQFPVDAFGRVCPKGHKVKNSGPPTVSARVGWARIATGGRGIPQLVAEPRWLAKPRMLNARQLRCV